MPRQIRPAGHTPRFGAVPARLMAVVSLWAACTGASCAAPLRVLVAAHELDALGAAAAAYTEREGVALTLEAVRSNADVPTAYEERGPFDALIASCDRSSKMWEDRKLVVPETRTELYWKRMAAFLPPGNPKGVLCLADLAEPGLRIGIQTLCEGRIDQTLSAIKSNVVAESTDIEILIDLLRRGTIDAIVTLDTSLSGQPGSLVTIRFPRSVCGELGETPVLMYVATSSGDPEAAAKLVRFMGTSPYATDRYLEHGLLSDDGVEWSRSYDVGAGRRFANVYRNVCKQVVDDYGITEGRALDIGCGPGQMTIELAKMTKLRVTGLDIEPEAIEIAQRHAEEESLSHRMKFVAADAHRLPFGDNRFALVVSRGTLPFLRDHVQVFREVYRVLKPGGVAFMGCGMGRGTTEEEIAKLGRPGGERENGFFRKDNVPREEAMFPFPLEDWSVLAVLAGIPADRCKGSDDGGTWVEIRK